MDLRREELIPQLHVKVAWGRIAPVTTAITKRNWRKEGRQKRESRKERRGEGGICPGFSREKQPVEALGSLEGRSLCFIKMALSLLTVFLGANSVQVRVSRASTGLREQQASPGCSHNKSPCPGHWNQRGTRQVTAGAME